MSRSEHQATVNIDQPLQVSATDYDSVIASARGPTPTADIGLRGHRHDRGQSPPHHKIGLRGCHLEHGRLTASAFSQQIHVSLTELERRESRPRFDSTVYETVTVLI